MAFNHERRIVKLEERNVSEFSDLFKLHPELTLIPGVVHIFEHGGTPEERDSLLQEIDEELRRRGVVDS
jgi:hypothetical protein